MKATQTKNNLRVIKMITKRRQIQHRREHHLKATNLIKMKIWTQVVLLTGVWEIETLTTVHLNGFRKKAEVGMVVVRSFMILMITKNLN